MKGIFVLPNSASSVLRENFAVFQPIGNSQNSCFSYDQLLKALSEDKKSEIYKKIINEFEKFKNSLSKDKFFAVFGLEKNDFLDTLSLNLEIAKHLNLPVVCEFDDEISLNIAKNQIKSQKLQNIANVLNKEFITENGDKFDIKADFSKIENLINSANSQILTPLAFENMLYKRASANLKYVVLPESDDERILKAAHIINESKAVKIVLLGDENEINSKAKNLGLNLDGIRIINPANNEYSDEFANTLYELRKAKGMELEKAKALVKDRTYFGTMLVYSGICDAMVSGASTTTAETIRPALQTIKMKPGVSTVSGSFLMCMDSEVYLFADCAITPNPTAEQLAGIVVSSAATASAFGIEPKIAMLSYSTGSSGSGEDVEFVINATNLAKELAPNLDIEGPIQFDAAVDKIVAAKKLPNSKVAGNANVFIFPNLNCGNICYKAVQRSSGAVAIGPILQGLKKPVNDLSRGCLVEDVVNTILISAIQAGEN